MKYQELKQRLRDESSRWLVTGAAGFIGSNLVEALLRLGQEVVGLDNFLTGHRSNLEEVRRLVGDEASRRFQFIEGDIRDLKTCRRAVQGARFVLHQAALGSVPMSIESPVLSNEINVSGFVNVLHAAREAEVERFVYASSSSVYGDDEHLPQSEESTGRLLSPYAATKMANELYAESFQQSYGIEAVGLRYFNVFGPRQDPAGPYAAVIPRWIETLLEGHRCIIFGDGETSRDFCYVANAVQANLLAACTTHLQHEVYNIACGEQTSLNQLYNAIHDRVAELVPGFEKRRPKYEDFRPGDIRHSVASIARAAQALGFSVSHNASQGLDEAAGWYVRASQASQV